MIIVWILLVAAALLAWQKLVLDRWNKDLSFTVRFSKDAVYRGDTSVLTEVVENRKKLPLPVVEAAFRIEKGIFFQNTENIIISDYNYKRDVFALRGMEAVRRTYHIECRKRGRYTISQSSLTSYSLLHREQFREDYPQTEEFYVYAARVNVQKILQQCDTILGEIESRRKTIEDPFSFASIRDYTIRDSMKTINWKASARMGSLMVNTYTSVRAERFCIFLDVREERIVRQEVLLEQAISIAASLAALLHARAQETDIHINTDPPAKFTTGGKAGALSMLERFLTTDFEKAGTTAFEEMVRTAEQDGERICLLISKELTRENASALQNCFTQGEKVLCICPMDPALGTDYDLWPLSGR